MTTPESQGNLVPFIIYTLVVALNSTLRFWSHDQKKEKWLINALSQGWWQEGVRDGPYIWHSLPHTDVTTSAWSFSRDVFSTVYNLPLLFLVKKSSSSKRQCHQLGMKAFRFHSNVFWSRTFNFPNNEDFFCCYCYTVKTLVPACDLYWEQRSVVQCLEHLGSSFWKRTPKAGHEIASRRTSIWNPAEVFCFLYL